MRIGLGYDVHALVSDRKLILGGVEVPFEKGLLGHSDADVLLHAVCDAVLGALSWGDIGHWFPDTDQKFKGADSKVLFSDIWKKAQEQGWALGNCDCVLMAQRPKLQPFIEPMRQCIAQLFGAELSQVSVKATTTERLGFVGREEGIAAHAVVLLEETSA